ncbi:uncharacterized protein N7487_007075 [Penicillium crustosum]|uniref:uncharacterized protein n=1 Tax=Penicillium crustosum TaxID=36656 RepID=UPI00239EE713|nr:uncharacterized protein N7487_007075 [Penicillium crustosum]KAJ5401179.1 hypothetical protein N7487_007075 [Penicillium crustosum]
MGSVSLCRDEVNSSLHLPCQADPLSGSDGCCLAPHLNAGGDHPPQWWYPGPSHAGSPGAPAVVTEARGPFGPRHRWGLWIDGRWPYPKLRFLEGSRPVGSAVRRRCPRGLDPSSEGHMPQPASAFTGVWSDQLRADWC